MSSWGKETVSFLRLSSLLEQDYSCGQDSARGLDRVKQTRNSVVGLPRKYLEGKARDMANQEEWVPFMDVLASLIFGVVLFPNVDGLVDLSLIHI